LSPRPALPLLLQHTNPSPEPLSNPAQLAASNALHAQQLPCCCHHVKRWRTFPNTHTLRHSYTPCDHVIHIQIHRGMCEEHIDIAAAILSLLSHACNITVTLRTHMQQLTVA
jgi:hypothetical protein